MIINPSSNRGEPVIPITSTPSVRTQLWIDTTTDDQNSSYYTAADTLTNSTKELFGLEENAVPDDAFKALLEKTENIPVPEAGMTMDLLWENENPNAAFAAQTIEMDLSEYAFFIIYEQTWFSGYGNSFHQILSANHSINHVRIHSKNNTPASRGISATSTGITFSNVGVSGCVGSENLWLVPQQIYGIKATSSSSSGGTVVTPDNVYTKDEIDDMLAGIGSGSSMKLLWENENPTTGFDAQTISVDLTGYTDLLFIIEPNSSQNENYASPAYTIGGFINIANNPTGFLVGSGTANVRRSFAINDNNITFGVGQHSSTYPEPTWKNGVQQCVPYCIYGIKQGEFSGNAPSTTSGLQMELLWENASPTSEFAAQKVELDLSDADFVALKHNNATFLHVLKVGDSVGLTANDTKYDRKATIDETGVTFTDQTYGHNNKNLVPLFICKIKGVTTA